ncbi:MULTISPECIES: TetR/AcrR family transcriptional regulator [Paenibacillus]|uniref:TetR/AcrR family transcriptional regulator n=1 Tax=Paenibacillus TaxID=44249 RepID=UPI0022B89851|nr:TetR/AcrR family transcriptional regulator [Paenibacillus caseinilyticus]MCZ8521274.1 TetR/AcrR family transcriptional regulator [Paenibacillus caseinilyticus]
MSPLNEDRLGQIRDQRKEQIMQAGLGVFARRGILGTKMSMIAAAAGVSHGLLYHYFKSKDELFTSLIEEAVVAADESVRQLYDLPGSPAGKLRLLTEQILQEDGAEYFMLIHQARTSDGVPAEAKELIAQYSMARFIDVMLPLFQEGQRLGEIVPEPAEELIASYFSVLSGLMVLHTRDSEYRIPDTALLLRMFLLP